MWQYLVFRGLYMITIKDYARETGVSYEAVRQRIKRYEDELGGHIHRQGRTQFLDDVAVAFLNEHRMQNPVILYDRGAGEDFRALQDELENSREETRDLRDQMKKKDEIMALLVQQNEQYRLQAASVARLEADNEIAKARANKAESVAQEAQEQLAKAHEAFERELNERERRTTAMAEYAAALEKYYALGWWQRRKAEKPAPPSFTNNPI